MRTTLTLDEDVAHKLKAEAGRTGKPFKLVVNETLRRGLLQRTAGSSRAPFRVKARDVGLLRPGLGLDDVAGLLEQLEGPLHR